MAREAATRDAANLRSREGQLMSDGKGKPRGPYKTPGEKRETVRKGEARQRARKFRDIAIEPKKELDKLGRGIMEDALIDDEDDRKLCKDDGEGSCDEVEEMNLNHQKDGEFASKDKATCRSSYFVDKKRERVGGSLTDKNTTGRGVSRSGQGKYRCKDNKPKWESLFKEYVENKVIEEEPVTIPTDSYEIAKKFKGYEEMIVDLKRQMSQARKKGLQSCPLSWESVAKIMNTLEVSRKGDLYKKEKES
jgi:hypothetical protein